MAGLLGAGIASERGSARVAMRRRPSPAAPAHDPARHLSPGHLSPGLTLAREDALGNARIEALARLGKPVFCGGHRGRYVAFTFDDGPGVYTHLALRKLRLAHARATFFVVGRSIDGFPGYLRPELRAGAIGDHTTTHPYLPGLGAAQVAHQLQRTRSMIERGTGERVDMFRPPYGALDPAVLHVARRLGLLAIMWTQDSRDSLGADWLGIIHNVAAALRPGAIILMHENHGQTIRALTSLLPMLRRRHLVSVSLPQLFALDPPSPAQLRAGSAGCGFTGAGTGSG